MSRRILYIFLTILALTTVACGFTINFPVDRITTGETQTEEIRVPYPDAETADLTLSVGAVELDVRPGAENALVTGTAKYNVEDFKPKIHVDGSEVRLETGNLDIQGIPRVDGDIINQWDLQLGEMPLNLTINAGACKADIDLGDLSLKSLAVNEGAAQVRMKFSQPNKSEMDTLRYVSGASDVKLSGLANANFASMIFRGGAGNYILDFSGQLRRDAVVTVESGMSHVVIVVPEGVSAKVIFQGGLANIDASNEWKKSGYTYTMSGNGPTLTINVDMGAGNLELRAG